VSARDELGGMLRGDDLAQRRQERFAVVWDEARKPPKPVLPVLPALADLAGQSGWMTSVLNLDVAHPITGGVHQGLSGGAGHVELSRLGAEALRFEPASKIASAQKLSEELVWQLLPTDGEPYPWSNPQAVKIARVVRLLCGATKARTTAQETALFVTTFIDAAEQVDGNTHGSVAERGEAVVRLRPTEDNYGRPNKSRYLVDADSGEFVVRVSDLLTLTRRLIGGSLAHGALDAWMDAFGWERRTLEGHSLPERPGDRGRHRRCDIYRGVLPPVDDPEDEGSVTT
jgi:hypothetical protein